MLGVDPIVNVKESIYGLNFFRVIRDFRVQYDDWYQGYKHGQRTMAIHIYPSNAEPTKENSAFPLYHIPKNMQELDGRIFVEDDFIDVLDKEPHFYKLIQDIVNLWKQLKKHQYPKVFPPTLQTNDNSTQAINPIA